MNKTIKTMKRKKAIKQIQEGKIQIENDLLPSTKQIKKFLKEAFPDDNYFGVEAYVCKYITGREEGINIWFYSRDPFENLPIIKLSAITKRKKTKLKEGEWRKFLAGGFIFLQKKVEGGFICYGKSSIGEWFNDNKWDNATLEFTTVPASEDEAKEFLINEAKKRYVEGNYVNPNINGWANNIKLRGQETIQLSRAGELLYFGVCVFKDGIWAEIKEQDINWDIPQLVISDKGKVVATNGNHLEYSFEGIVVVSDISLQPVNHFSNKWGKLYFKPFKRELIIK